MSSFNYDKFLFILLRQFKKYPEFTGLQKYVWEYLTQPGKPIFMIQNDGKSYSKTDERKCIWHNKTELDKFVVLRLGLNLDDYTNENGNKLYKEIAGEIRRLRLKNILVDWKRTKSGRGMGIWRLAGSKINHHSLLEEYAIKYVKQEIKQKNFHSDGSIQTIYARTKQTAFKNILQNQYHKCVLCGFKIPEYMIGAHIVPYNIMKKEEPKNSMNPTNGLLFCRLCDTAFERGDVIVEKDLGIKISENLRDNRTITVRRWLTSILSEIKINEDIEYPPDSRFLKWKKELVLVEHKDRTIPTKSKS